jgi:hypothetical protein
LLLRDRSAAALSSMLSLMTPRRFISRANDACGRAGSHTQKLCVSLWHSVQLRSSCIEDTAGADFLLRPVLSPKGGDLRLRYPPAAVGASSSTGCAQIRAAQGRFSTTNHFPFWRGAVRDDAPRQSRTVNSSLTFLPQSARLRKTQMVRIRPAKLFVQKEGGTSWPACGITKGRELSGPTKARHRGGG